MRHLITVHAFESQYAVELWQTGKGRFSVEYGADIRHSLSYAQAAKEFGLCVMHAAACAGEIAEDEVTE
jgi:hypothetical protein